MLKFTQFTNFCVDTLPYNIYFRTEFRPISTSDPGIDYNRPDSNGDTCLHYAIKTNNTFLISLLLINGADPYIKNRDGLNSFKLLKNNRDWQQNYSILKQLSK
ncbi:MAG: transcriptional regulator swi6 [Marteilia pararefringens]